MKSATIINHTVPLENLIPATPKKRMHNLNWMKDLVNQSTHYKETLETELVEQEMNEFIHYVELTGGLSA